MKVKYCYNCGEKCKFIIDFADKYNQNPDSKCDTYDEDTGERLYAGWYECPNYKERFWFGNDHESRSYCVNYIFQESRLPKEAIRLFEANAE